MTLRTKRINGTFKIEEENLVGDKQGRLMQGKEVGRR